MMEVLFDQDMHINAMVNRERLFQIKKHRIYLECLIVVHRRCRSKVGNYCGCKEKTFLLYEQWKQSVCYVHFHDE